MNEVTLIAMTQPVEGMVPRTSEELIAYCARVSNPENQDNMETSAKLLHYLAHHSHWSPFEMVSVVMKVCTTRDIARQILRHRSFSFQEFSQRYAEIDTSRFVFRESRMQDATNRQSSLPCDDADLAAWWNNAQREQWTESISLYRRALDKGLAKEVARSLLPEGLTPSVMYMSGSLRSWIHYIQLRSGNGTQKEHQDVARQCVEILLEKFPVLSEVLNGC